MLPWFHDGFVPLYLAPMAGVTDVVFRQLCKELGADVMVTEFVSAEGIVRRDDRTRHYAEFTEEQRPVGVQLFGANPASLAEAARKIVDWKRPDFLDLNVGCPVNKVVAKNGGSSLLLDPPLLGRVARAVAAAAAERARTAQSSSIVVAPARFRPLGAAAAATCWHGACSDFVPRARMEPPVWATRAAAASA